MSKMLPVSDLVMRTPRPSKNVPERRSDNDVKRQFTPLSYRYNKSLDENGQNVIDHGSEAADDADGFLACTKHTARSLTPAIPMSRQKDVERRCGGPAAAVACNPVTIWNGSLANARPASTGHHDTARPEHQDGIDGSRSSCMTQAPSHPGMLFSGGSSASQSHIGVNGQGSATALKAKPVMATAFSAVSRASSPRADCIPDSLLQRSRSAASPSPAFKRLMYNTVTPSPARASTRSPVRLLATMEHAFTGGAMEDAISPRTPFFTATPVTATPLTAECERSQSSSSLHRDLPSGNQLRASAPSLPRAEPVLQRHQSFSHVGMRRQSSLTELPMSLMARAGAPARQSASVRHSSPGGFVRSPHEMPICPGVSTPRAPSVGVHPAPSPAIPQVMAQPVSPRRSAMGLRQRSQDCFLIGSPGAQRFVEQPPEAPGPQPPMHQLEGDLHERQLVHQQLQKKIEQLQTLQDLLKNQQDQLLQQQGRGELQTNHHRNAELDELQMQLHQERRLQQELQHQQQQPHLLRRPQQRQAFGSYAPVTLGDDHGLKSYNTDAPGSRRSRSNSANSRRRRFLV
eukprot:TRINITY_DN26031_c0_g1_i1.p1 TRINITY_DN26031_c0_g1~~TRINITY_DN26031_c0_g1_i1.p1  ORF type:complete len:572 (-),score=74.24 TRINITY_DN26031_c0_g1_i1:65-1780(-)